jgi:formate hydrogenlyase subunit 3/multisubunit Na+/H+ antiporter MnhD subunit
VAHALILGMLGLPLCGAVALLVRGRRLTAHQVNRLALVSSALALMCALGVLSFLLLPTTPASLDLFPIEWLPGTGVMRLHVDPRTLLILVSVTLALVLVLFAEETGQSGETGVGTEATGDGNRAPAALSGLALIALTGTQIAILSGSFLSRYLALEVVGLCLGLAPLIAARDGFRRAARVYLVLRVGDAGLLIAVLMLMQLTGTLDITAALASAPGLAVSQRLWIAGAFVLAVWVKVGAWPLHIWLQDAEALPFVSRVWLFAVSMPMLGLYLLYRVVPLLQTVSPLREGVLVAAGIATVAALILALRRRRRPHALATYLWSAAGGAALCLAALGVQPGVWVWALAMPLFVAVSGRDVSRGLPLTTGVEGGQDLRAGAVLVTDVPAVKGGLTAPLDWLYRVVELGTLNAMVTATVSVMGFLTRLVQRLEQGALDALVGVAVGGTRLVARRVPRWHTGRLRLNLLWVVVSLVVALFILINGG